MKTTEKKPERQIHFDLLRILACFMVVVLHAASRFFDTTPVEAENWMAYNAYDALVRSAVPLFVMLSGVFFLAAKAVSKIHWPDRAGVCGLVGGVYGL